MASFNPVIIFIGLLMARKKHQESPDTADGILIGYARVSTEGQDPQTQVNALVAFGVPVEKIYVEKISGVKGRRPQFELMKKDLRTGDTLVVHSLSRIGRSVEHLLAFNGWLLSEGIALKSLTEPIDTRTADGKLMFTMRAAFAQFERDVTIERTRATQSRMREEGHKFGAPRQIKDATLAAIQKDLEKTKLSIPQIAKKHGKAPSTVNYYYPGWRSKTAAQRKAHLATRP